MLAPTDQQQALAEMKRALANKEPIHFIGNGSLSKLTPASDINCPHTRLSSQALTKVHFYEPEETVIKLDAGVKLGDLRQLLANEGQLLGFDPPDFSWLAQNRQAGATIGGVVAAGLTGPQRVNNGGIRDFLLGAEFIDGTGSLIRAGSRVIKNVTGYDISKLLAGSWGQLGMILNLTLRTSIAPPASRTLQVSGIAIDAAVAIMIRLQSLPTTPRALTYYNQASSKLLQQDSGKLQPAQSKSNAAVGTLLIQYAGSEGALKLAIAAARQSINQHNPAFEHRLLAQSLAKKTWQLIRDLQVFATLDATTFSWYRIAAPATVAEKVLNLIGQEFPCLVDCSGSRIWLAINVDNQQHHAITAKLATLVSKVSPAGHVWLVRRATNGSTAGIASLPQPDAARAHLEAKIKSAFDPKRLFTCF